MKRIFIATTLALTLLLSSLFTGHYSLATGFAPEPEFLADGELHLPILMYHKVLKSKKGKYIVTPSQLEEDFIALKEAGFETVFMSEVIDWVDDRGTLPDKPILITFDDGQYNNIFYGLEIAKRHNVKIMLNPVTSFSKFSTDTGDHSNPNYSHMTWDQIKEAVDTGLVEIGNHSHNMHKFKPRFGIMQKAGENLETYKENLSKDIQMAQELISQAGAPIPTTFAYPFGKYSKISKQFLLDMGFRALLTCNEGINSIKKGEPSSLHALRRYNRDGWMTTEKVVSLMCLSPKSNYAVSVGGFITANNRDESSDRNCIDAENIETEMTQPHLMFGDDEIAEEAEKLFEKSESEPKKFIKWVEFNANSTMMNRAQKAHKQLVEKGVEGVGTVELLAYLALKNGNNFNTKRDTVKLNDIVQKLVSDNREEFDKYKENRFYRYYTESFHAVLDGIIDPKTGITIAHHPIAKGYWHTGHDDFGNSRSFGFKRRHLGHDLFGGIGTPIIAVEGGTITELGWNRFGGWRVGIRSEDAKRYYYYAHLRRSKPFPEELKLGDTVKAGDVVGYLGNTGYSSTPNTNMKTSRPHLHFGMQLIFDPSQEDGNGEIWIDVYQICKFLESHKKAAK